MNRKTKTIAGREITLIEDVRYVASRPWASRYRTEYPITIQPEIGSPLEAESVTLDGFTYEQANAFLAEFNNGPTSFDGRRW